MQIRYFAWMRERVGTAVEEVDPGAATTARELAVQLAAIDDGHALAFADLSAIRVAINQEIADLDSPIAGAREIAFFPPVTGG
ncbi:MAG: molybdopterin converting factor subunit 1 [Pikeienuella sp.]